MENLRFNPVSIHLPAPLSFYTRLENNIIFLQHFLFGFMGWEYSPLPHACAPGSVTKFSKASNDIKTVRSRRTKLNLLFIFDIYNNENISVAFQNLFLLLSNFPFQTTST